MEEHKYTMFTIQGEPTVVTEMREKILREFQDLEFYEEGHRYLLHGKELCSVSGIADRFVANPFDTEVQAAAYAARHGKTADYWKQQWECNAFRATTLGTKSHEFGESLAYLKAGHPEFIRPSVQAQYLEKFQFLAPIHPKEEAVVEFLNKMPESYHLVLNETKVYSGKNPDESKNLTEQICGTFDMLYYYDGEGDESRAGFVLFDYKTNGDLYSDFNRRRHVTLLPPFEDTIDEPLGHYIIQLSLYALMLEDIGLKVLGRRIVWLKNDGTFEVIPLPDVSDRLRQAL